MTDIFFYLLENYAGINQCPDAPTLARRLSYEGFDEQDVRAAVILIELLRQPLVLTFVNDIQSASQRIYHPDERAQIGDEHLNFLDSLTHTGSITQIQRERIVERCMTLPFVPDSAAHFKAVLLTILWAENEQIDDMLLYNLMDETEGDVCH